MTPEQKIALLEQLVGNIGALLGLRVQEAQQQLQNSSATMFQILWDNILDRDLETFKQFKELKARHELSLTILTHDVLHNALSGTSPIPKA